MPTPSIQLVRKSVCLQAAWRLLQTQMPRPPPSSTRQPGPLQGGWSQGHCWNGGHSGGGIQHLARCPAPRPGSSSMPTGLGHIFGPTPSFDRQANSSVAWMPG